MKQFKNSPKVMSFDDALKVESNGNTAVYNSLMYGSYKANRSYGLTHEQLVKIGIGNDDFKARYENGNAHLN